MLKIGIVGCGLQAATIAGYMGIYGDAYEVAVVMDLDFENAQMRIKQKEVRLAADCVFCHTLEEFMAAAGNLNGILIGTYCASHTEVACRLEVLGIPEVEDVDMPKPHEFLSAEQRDGSTLQAEEIYTVT